MVKMSCHWCGVRESKRKGIALSTCTKCKSVSYCSKKCQVRDWKAQHKDVCSYLSAGEAKQMLNPCMSCEENKGLEELSLAVAGGIFKNPSRSKRFFDIFFNSTKKNLSPKQLSTLARDMRRILLRTPKPQKSKWFVVSLVYLTYHATEESLELPTCPINLFFPGLDPGQMVRDSDMTPLHFLAMNSDPSDERKNKTVVQLAKKIVAAGANVNAIARKKGGYSVLHLACHCQNASNLDFIKVLLKNGADPNVKNDFGETPLFLAIDGSPGAAKFLLEYSKDMVDVNTTSGEGISVLQWLRSCIFVLKSATKSYPDDTKAAVWKHHIQQMKEVESILVARGAIAIGSEDAIQQRFFQNEFWLECISKGKSKIETDGLLKALDRGRYSSVAGPAAPWAPPPPPPPPPLHKNISKYYYSCRIPLPGSLGSFTSGYEMYPEGGDNAGLN